ncbi:unnamed protein product [Blepharisma stoltei]|uniref:Uncharacterized protein n=1 Tax=Blepharisma stoltei TaxID=1481888 RepID=A0AAU9IWE1_9CILI|nr:unnamed protein product [Blepharisma stoltei]
MSDIIALALTSEIFIESEVIMNALLFKFWWIIFVIDSSDRETIGKLPENSIILWAVNISEIKQDLEEKLFLEAYCRKN